MSQAVRDPFLEGNEIIEEAIARFHRDQSKENLIAVLEGIRSRMHADGHFVIPVVIKEDEMTYSFRALNTNDGGTWNVVFTSREEFEKSSHNLSLAKKIIRQFLRRMG